MHLPRSLTAVSLVLALAASGTAAAQTPASPAPAADAAPAAQAPATPGPAETPAEAAAEHRFALVIGNGQYRAQRPVPSAALSARRVAEALRRAGFEVEEATDLDRTALEAAVRGFGERLRGAQVGAFYYAGHGRMRGQPGQAAGLCMEPVDAPARDPGALLFECVPFAPVLGQLEQNAPAALVFWDAALPGRRAAAAAGSGAGPGPAAGPVRPRGMVASGVALVFAGQPGEAVANPDATEQVSPFADALANAVTSPGLDVLDILRQVRRDVRGATADAQTPWFRYGLEDELVLVPRPPAPPVAEAPATAPAPAASFSLAWQTRTPPPDPVALELAAWNAVTTMRSDNARRAGLIDFLQRFPSGQYASLARINLDDLDRPAAPAASAPPDPLTLELAEWQTVLAITAPAQKNMALQGYLQRYPNGRFAPLARLQLAEMNEPAPPAAAANGQAGQPTAAQQAAAQAAAQQAAQQAGQPAAGQRYMIVRAVPLRFEANQDGRIVRTLQPFTVVVLRQRYARDAWMEVQVGAERGFVFGNAMKDIREAEEEEWARIQNSRDRGAYELFLRRFPGGAFANEATRRRDQLAAAPAAPAAPQ